MEYGAFYQERINFRFMYFLAAFLGLISAAMLVLFIYHFTVAPVDDEPGVGWVFLIEFLVMGAVAWLVLNFTSLDIILSYQGVIIRFGRFKRTVPWSEIASYRAVTSGSFLNQGGLKIGLSKQGWYSSYTVLGKPRIVLQLRSGRIKQLVFSTGNPQEVLLLVKKHTGKDESPGL